MEFLLIFNNANLIFVHFSQIEAAVSKSVAKGVQLSVLEQMDFIERQLSQQVRTRKDVSQYSGTKRRREPAFR